MCLAHTWHSVKEAVISWPPVGGGAPSRPWGPFVRIRYRAPWSGFKSPSCQRTRANPCLSPRGFTHSCATRPGTRRGEPGCFPAPVEEVPGKRSWPGFLRPGCWEAPSGQGRGPHGALTWRWKKDAGPTKTTNVSPVNFLSGGENPGITKAVAPRKGKVRKRTFGPPSRMREVFWKFAVSRGGVPESRRSWYTWTVPLVSGGPVHIRKRREKSPVPGRRPGGPCRPRGGRAGILTPPVLSCGWCRRLLPEKPEKPWGTCGSGHHALRDAPMP